MFGLDRIVKYPGALAQNAAAVAYATVGHGFAIALLCAPDWPLRAAGVALAVHTLLIASYLVHECMHDTIFRSRTANAALGAALAWLGDGALVGYEPLRRKHLHHHFDRIDPLGFDYGHFLGARPRLCRLVVALEWAHLPAVELLLRGAAVARGLASDAPAAERRRVVGVVAGRFVFAAALLALGPSVLGLYALAYVLFLVVARFFDAFHHSFDVVVMPDFGVEYAAPPRRDRIYEQANTYSNVISQRHPVWNAVLLLNFSYHNAHHAKPGIPWHSLPAVDAKLLRREATTAVPLRRLVGSFHRHRLDRLAIRPIGSARPHGAHADPVGATAVSLLTL